MTQATFDDDELFGEAAREIRDDVESSLDEARDVLPESSAVWDVDADNTLGVLNGLKGALATEEAAEHLRDARKWYTMGRRAEAFEDPDDLESEIAALDDLIETLADAREQVGELASTVPQLRSALDDIDTSASTDGSDGDDSADESGTETEASVDAESNPDTDSSAESATVE